MKATFVFGHKNPDTDSVCSSIAVANLRTQLGENAIPRILGDLNAETEFVLKSFKQKKPKYLNDVRLQIRDIEYGKGISCNEKDSLFNVIKQLKQERLSSLPVVDDNNKYLGLVSMKTIANSFISWEDDVIDTSLKNIEETLNAESLLKFDDEIKGNILVASYRSSTFIKNVDIDENTVLIVGDRHSIIEYAVEQGVKLIIITGNNVIKEKHIEIAKKNKVNIVRTPLRTFNVVKIIGMCNYAKTLLDTQATIFEELDYVRDFNEIHDKLRFKMYPVINRERECLGVIQPSDLSNKVRKKVVLVDHNEKDQTVDGIDEAEIVGIVDHHKFGTIGTSQPINIRNMPVGCTATIVFQLYKENNVLIPRQIAGLMLSAIISDTLLFRSPTTTQTDIDTAKKLAKIANVDMETYAIEMFKAGSSIKGKSMEELLFTDFKNFNEDDYKIGIGQINTLNIDDIKEREQELIDTLEKEGKNNGYNIIALFVTDIINEGSYIYYSAKSESILSKAFDIEDMQEGYYLPGVISRKKQIIPNILKIIDNK
jgi:manganese-dependent inorganic pyrophosphatase